MKKILYGLIISAGISSCFAMDDLTYTISSSESSPDGAIYMTIQNNNAQRLVINRFAVSNSNGDMCIASNDFIIRPHTKVVMLPPFSQFKCFGISNDLVIDSSSLKTDLTKSGNTKEDIHIKMRYTRGFQPDSYSSNQAFSLFFKN